MQYFSYVSINGCMTTWKMDVNFLRRLGSVGKKRSSVVSLLKPSESDRLPKLNIMHPCSFLSFLFFLCKTFLTILAQQEFSIGNSVQALRRPCEGSRKLFVEIYRFSFADLLQNILTESLVMYRIQMQT